MKCLRDVVVPAWSTRWVELRKEAWRTRWTGKTDGRYNAYRVGLGPRTLDSATRTEGMRRCRGASLFHFVTEGLCGGEFRSVNENENGFHLHCRDGFLSLRVDGLRLVRRD